MGAILSLCCNKSFHFCFLSNLKRWIFDRLGEKMLEPHQKISIIFLFTKQHINPFSLFYFPSSLFHLQPNIPKSMVVMGITSCQGCQLRKVKCLGNFLTRKICILFLYGFLKRVEFFYLNTHKLYGVKFKFWNVRM